MGRVVVLGSYNLDIVASVRRFPAPGETLHATGLLRSHGGKGSNQAVAAARAGASVTFAGGIGDDDAGAGARALWQVEGIRDATAVQSGAVTGLALILVDAQGENQIVVAAGANAAVSAAEAEAASGMLEVGDIALAQLETPLASVQAFLGGARRAGATTVLNAAPVPAVGCADLLSQADILVVNEGEAMTLCTVREQLSPAAMGRILMGRRGLRGIVITAGEAGAFLFTSGGAGWHQAAAPIRPVDTTGAGDAFTGAFVAALARKATFGDALADGVAAGGLACMKGGAVAALPGAAAIVAARRALPPLCPL